MPSARLFGGAAAALVVAVACGPSTSAPAPPTGFMQMSDSVKILITNRNFADATIRLFHSGANGRRLGRVTGASEMEFTIPWNGVDLYLEIRMQAGGTFYTDRIVVDQGDYLDLQIPINISSSNFRTRPPF